MAEQNAQVQALQQQAQTLDTAHRIIGQLYQQLVETTTVAQQLQQQVAQLTQPKPGPPPGVVPSFQTVQPTQGNNSPVADNSEEEESVHESVQQPT